jgi:bifunctional DNase/RNase
MSIQMELHRIIISDMQERQVIYLKEVDGEREFPIQIGSVEADAINRRLKGILVPRPLTHDLLASVIEHLGGELDHIEINNLHDATFLPGCIFARMAN